MSVVLLGSPGHWECPNCDRTLVTRPEERRTPIHRCKGLHGLSAPFIVAGTRAKVEAVPRGDYVGTERPQTDADGKPWMSVVTTREDGQDCTVLAPLAARVTGNS